VAAHVRYFFKGLLVFSYLNEVFNMPSKGGQAFLLLEKKEYNEYLKLLIFRMIECDGLFAIIRR